MAHSTDLSNAAAGLAALSITESLLLALTDLKVISKNDWSGILRDAAAAHDAVDPAPDAAGIDAEASAVINRIIDGKNSIPRPI